MRMDSLTKGWTEGAQRRQNHMAGNHSNTSGYAKTPKLPNIPAERCRRVGRPWIWTGASSGHKDVLSIEDGVIPAKKNIQYMPTRVETADLPAKSTRLKIDQSDGIESHSRRIKDDDDRVRRNIAA